jgi:hypothetical protein
MYGGGGRFAQSTRWIPEVIAVRVERGRCARAFSLVFDVRTRIASTWAAPDDRSPWVPFLPPHHCPRSREIQI